MRALGPPQMPRAELQQLKAPVLPEDFSTRVRKLNDEIYRRSIGIDKARVVSLGQERFARLCRGKHSEVISKWGHWLHRLVRSHWWASFADREKRTPILGTPESQSSIERSRIL
jgi:hypothetical protein